MKKIVKGTTFFAVMFLLLISLTACGEDKLTLTRVDDNVKMTVELKFKNDKVVESKTTYQYDSEESAKEGKEKFENLFSVTTMKDVEVKQDGKNVVITIDGKKFAEQYGFDYEKDSDSLKKEELRRMFQESGYKVK